MGETFKSGMFLQYWSYLKNTNTELLIVRKISYFSSKKFGKMFAIFTTK